MISKLQFDFYLFATCNEIFNLIISHEQSCSCLHNSIVNMKHIRHGNILKWYLVHIRHGNILKWLNAVLDTEQRNGRLCHRDLEPLLG